MREIKFRAWDGVNWIYSTTIKRDENARNWMIYDFSKSEWVYCGEPKQYTGLKDKNGREIYEGDLFQWEENAVGVIKYKDGSFYLETNIALPGDSVHAPGFYSPWLRVIKHELETELEVIGNIYENPELLEETK